MAGLIDMQRMRIVIEAGAVPSDTVKLATSLARTGQSGFTLIELMMVVAIIGILAAIALPNYRDHVTRGRLVDATNELASMRARMEQYYQDNRTYMSGGAVGAYPCASTYTVGSFTISCTSLTANTFTIVATGAGPVADFIFTINQTGAQSTTKLPTSWGSASASSPKACWVTQKGGSC